MVIEQFTLKKEHLIMLAELAPELEWDDCGGDGIGSCIKSDTKKPYGNASFEILMEKLNADCKTCPHCDKLIEKYSKQNVTEVYQLHEETLNALEIILTLRTFKLGDYIKEEGKWIKC